MMFILSQFARFIKRKHAVVIVVLTMWIYAFITGMSPSVLRAVFMFSVLSIAQISGKNYLPVNTLFFTGFALMLINPYTLFDIGFQLSFLAMLGIFLFYESIECTIQIKNNILRKVWQGTAIGFAAQLMTTPLSLYYFHQFPNYFVLTNIGLMASSGLILGVGLLIFSIRWWGIIAKWIALLLTLVVSLSLEFIEWVEKLPGAVAYGFEPSIYSVLALNLLIIAIFLLVKTVRQLAILGTIGMILLGIIVWQRHLNCTTNELCVFNTRQVIISVLKDQELFCFYKAKAKDFHKVAQVMQGYVKLHPASVHYMPIKNKKWMLELKKFKLSISDHYAYIDLKMNKRAYRLITSDFSEMSTHQAITIGMPWVTGEVDHSLRKKGAFMRKLTLD